MSKIEWTDATANWIVGCTKISPGCKNCYAAVSASSGRLQQFPQYKTVVDGNGNWNGHIEFVPKVLDGLLKGQKERRVFAPSMSDPFHPNVKDEWLDQLFAVVQLTPHVTYQLLTKRPERMYDYCRRRTYSRERGFYRAENALANPHIFPNLHLGISVENQAAADERIPWLLKTPAVKRFLSLEPLLSEVDLQPFLPCETIGGVELESWPNQIIVGGESGPGARPFHLEWARSLRQQCQDSGTAFFLKQVGSNPFLGGEPLKLKTRKGGDLAELPEDLRVRELI